jgi:DNA-binding XRE family transcriptional regulator
MKKRFSKILLKLGPEFQLDIKTIRAEIGLSQTDFAMLLGVSPRTLQSYEQNWRNLGINIEKSALMALLCYRNREKFGEKVCWEETDCPPRVRKNCMAYWARQGHLCWLISGTYCKGVQIGSWKAKFALCLECDFFHTLLRGDLPLLTKDKSDNGQSSEKVTKILLLPD